MWKSSSKDVVRTRRGLTNTVSTSTSSSLTSSEFWDKAMTQQKVQEAPARSDAEVRLVIPHNLPFLQIPGLPHGDLRTENFPSAQVWADAFEASLKVHGLSYEKNWELSFTKRSTLRNGSSSRSRSPLTIPRARGRRPKRLSSIPTTRRCRRDV